MRIKYTEGGVLITPETKREVGGLNAFCLILKNFGELLELSGNVTMDWGGRRNCVHNKR